MKRRLFMAFAGLCTTAVLAGCAETKEAIGIGAKTAPDEFAVYQRAPLSLPPDYELRPPQPGAARPQAEDTTDLARKSMLEGRDYRVGGGGGSGERSLGEMALLRQAGAVGVDPDIRAKINREGALLANEDSRFTDQLMFWQEQEPAGKVVDASAEAQRIRENQALGRPITEGNTPVIERRRKKAIFEGILN